MTVPVEVKLTRHECDLDDDGHEIIENAVTSETDTTLVYSPDGAGGVVARAESVGTDLSAINFLVGTASADLSAEIVVGTTPGGELGGTWASPTVDATHAGSTHIALSSATPLVESGAGSAGSGTAASKDDHVHPAAAAATQHYLVIASSHSTPLAFDDLVQSSAGDDFIYST